MGKENTIRTGVTSGNRRSQATTNTSISNNSGLVNTGLGRVTISFADKSIEYISLNNQYGFTKRGYAVPFDPNISNPPPVGASVILISAPIITDENDTAQFGGRKTFYSLTINSNSNVGGTIVNSSGDGGYAPPTKLNLTSQQQKDNALYIKNYLKEKGLSKEATAAILGNMYQESGLNPTSGWIDINGLESFGLIQWNGSRDGSGKGIDLRKIPNDVKGQLDALFDPKITANFQIWLKEVTNNPTGTNSDGMSGSEYLAYTFAKGVEVCYNCTKGVAVYKDPSSKFKPYSRSQKALEFLNLFDSPNDALAWNGVKAPYVNPNTNNNNVLTSTADFTKSQTFTNPVTTN
jgi:hypothetical protein